MASRAPYDDAHHVDQDGTRDLLDSGYDTEPSIPTESSHFERTGRRTSTIDCSEPISRAVSAAQARLRQLSAGPASNGSAAPPTFQRFPTDLTTVVATAQYEALFRDLRTALNRPEITIDQQRQLCTLLDTTVALREELRCPVPGNFVQSILTPPTLAGASRRRPLTAAAVLQNVRARTRRAYSEALAADRLGLTTPEIQSQYPVRYGHAYDDILGISSANEMTDDGSPAQSREDYARSRPFNHGDYFGLNGPKGHSYVTTEDRHLIETRQARALGGLSTASFDEEIDRRVSEDPGSWGWLGVLWCRHFPIWG
jgi:hypothetical protein